MIMIGAPVCWRPVAYDSSRRRQIIDDEIRQAARCRCYSRTVSGPHQKGYRSCVPAHLDIRRLVSDDDAVLKSEPQIACRLLHQAKLRLTATAVVLGPMRTDIDSVQPNPRFGKQLL